MADACTRLVTNLLLRPMVRRRGCVAYLTVRSWRADTREADLAAFKAEKRAKAEPLLGLAGTEIADEVRALVHPTSDWSVTAVAPGHSRDAMSWGVLLATVVAHRLGLPFRPAFCPRPSPGSSHPRRNASLPPLEWDQVPTGPMILVDDVATSGWHMAEGLEMLRRSDVPALGAAWISGTIRASNPSATGRAARTVLAGGVRPWLSDAAD